MRERHREASADPTRVPRERIRAPGAAPQHGGDRIPGVQAQLVRPFVPVLPHGQRLRRRQRATHRYRDPRRADPAVVHGRPRADDACQVGSTDRRHRLRSRLRRPHHRARQHAGQGRREPARGLARCFIVDLGVAGGPRAGSGRAADRIQPRRQLEPARIRRLRHQFPNLKDEIVSGVPAALVRRQQASTRRRTAPAGGLLHDAEARPVRELAAVPLRPHADRQLEPGHPGVQRAHLPDIEQPAIARPTTDAVRAGAELLASDEQRLRRGDLRVGRAGPARHRTGRRKGTR